MDLAQQTRSRHKPANSCSRRRLEKKKFHLRAKPPPSRWIWHNHQQSDQAAKVKQNSGWQLLTPVGKLSTRLKCSRRRGTGIHHPQTQVLIEDDLGTHFKAIFACVTYIYHHPLLERKAWPGAQPFSIQSYDPLLSVIDRLPAACRAMVVLLFTLAV